MRLPRCVEGSPTIPTIAAILTISMVSTVSTVSTSAELPVTYLVEAKPFKKNVSAGDHDTEV